MFEIPLNLETFCKALLAYCRSMQYFCTSGSYITIKGDKGKGVEGRGGKNAGGAQINKTSALKLWNCKFYYLFDNDLNNTKYISLLQK